MKGWIESQIDAYCEVPDREEVQMTAEFRMKNLYPTEGIYECDAQYEDFIAWLEEKVGRQTGEYFEYINDPYFEELIDFDDEMVMFSISFTGTLVDDSMDTIYMEHELDCIAAALGAEYECDWHKCVAPEPDYDDWDD